MFVKDKSYYTISMFSSWCTFISEKNIENKKQNVKYLHTSFFTEVLYIAVKKISISISYLSIGEWWYKLWNTQVLEYYVAIKNHFYKYFYNLENSCGIILNEEAGYTI